MLAGLVGLDYLYRVQDMPGLGKVTIFQRNAVDGGDLVRIVGEIDG